MTESLGGKRILVVEDEYILANDLADFLQAQGAIVVGPVGTVDAALRLVALEQPEAAVLDVNLHARRVYPVADALIRLGAKIVFVTGYDELLMERAYIGLPRCQKPIDKEALLKVLVQAIAGP